MSILEGIAVGIVVMLIGLIIGEAVVALMREEKARRIQRWKDEGYDLGFRAGADIDDKTRRIGERASRLGR